MPTVFLLGLSLALNACFALAGLVWFVRRGGLRRFTPKKKGQKRDVAVQAVSSLLAVLPAPARRPVVFFGDSLTAHSRWDELLDLGVSVPMLNRGIGGDTSEGLLERVDQVIAVNPLIVCLMIGTNDAGTLQISAAETVRNIAEIVRRITSGSPDCRVVVQGVLPTRNPDFNQRRVGLNELLRKTEWGRQAQFVDFSSAFLQDGALNKAFTLDGVHLTGQGYLEWKRQIEPVLCAILGKVQSTGR